MRENNFNILNNNLFEDMPDLIGDSDDEHGLKHENCDIFDMMEIKEALRPNEVYSKKTTHPDGTIKLEEICYENNDKPKQIKLYIKNTGKFICYDTQALNDQEKQNAISCSRLTEKTGQLGKLRKYNSEQNKNIANEVLNCLHLKKIANLFKYRFNKKILNSNNSPTKNLPQK